MTYSRREIALTGALAAAGLAGEAKAAPAGGAPLYGLISQVIAAPEQRDALARILVEATAELPGCLSFIVAADAGRDDALWITEAWTSKESHDASFSLPKVAAGLEKGRALITGVGARAETTPVGGLGLGRR